MAKKVLYISYDGMTDPLGQSQVLPYLIALSGHGYEFTILSFEKKARFEKEKNIINSICQNSGIKWIPLRYTKTPPVLSKMYDRWRMTRTSSALYKKYKFDLIHCRSYIAAEMGLKLKKKYGVKFLFDMRGFWPEEKIDSGQWNLNNPIYRRAYRHYKKKEKEFLNNADGIISLTAAAKRVLLANMDFMKLDVRVIPCCADLEHFNFDIIDKGEASRLREELGAGTNKILTYLGSLGGWYMTKEMFLFFKKVLIKYPDFVMLMLTKDDPEKVSYLATEAGIPPGRIKTRYAVRKELPAYLSLSDLSIFFIRPSFSKIASSPTKHAELMGMGVPVVCNDIGDTGMIVEETNTGLVVKEFTEEEYDRVIENLDGLMTIPREKIRAAAFQYFNLENGVSEYLKLYEKILNQ